MAPESLRGVGGTRITDRLFQNGHVEHRPFLVARSKMPWSRPWHDRESATSATCSSPPERSSGITDTRARACPPLLCDRRRFAEPLRGFRQQARPVRANPRRLLRRAARRAGCRPHGRTLAVAVTARRGRLPGGESERCRRADPRRHPRRGVGMSDPGLLVTSPEALVRCAWPHTPSTTATTCRGYRGGRCRGAWTVPVRAAS